MPDELEHLDTIVKRLGIVRRETIPDVEPDPVCRYCGGAGYLRYDVPVDDARFGQLIVCECTRKELGDKRQQIIVKSSRLGALRHLTFETWAPKFRDGPPPVNSPDDAFHTAQMYAERLSFNDRPWLLFSGTVGTGKTHLAAAIGNYRLDRGEPAVFMVVPELLDHLRAAYSPNSEIGYDELFESLKNTPLLILDDLGSHAASPWARDKMFQLINHRYNSKIATVVTMNAEQDGIDDRLQSRIRDRNLTTVFEVTGPDYRTSDARHPRRAAPSYRSTGRRKTSIDTP